MYDYEDEEDDLFGPPPQSIKPATGEGIDFKKEVIPNGEFFRYVSIILSNLINGFS